MFTTFQVDWTSTSSKTTSTKNFDLKRDGRADGRTDVQTRKHNAHKWGIKKLEMRNTYDSHLQTTTTEHQIPDLGQVQTIVAG